MDPYRVPASAQRGPPPLVLLAISVAAAGGAIALARGVRPEAFEIIERRLDGGEAARLALNTGGIVDAIADRATPPRVGWRYRVLTEAAARSQVDAVARIGGRVTFVAGARPGEIRLVEVTAVKETTADAVPIGPAESTVTPSAVASPVVHSLTGTVEGVGSRGDGRLRVDGLTVYIPGAQPGERVVFEIIRRDDRYGVARLIEKLPPAAAERPVQEPSTQPIATPGTIAATSLSTGVVSGVGSRGDGYVRLGGLPIYVPGTAPGDRIVFEVVRRQERHGIGRLVEKLPASAAAQAPSPAAAAGPVRLSVGDIHEVTITERAYRNPEREGVARIGGRAVIVPGVATGQTVRVRITEVRERMAFGEVVDGPAGGIAP